MSDREAEVAIVDYELGNLFSVKHACEHAGLRAIITTSRQEILAADAVILPGVGAYGDAMAVLAKLDLVAALRDFAASGKPLVGICLGMQLLMTESFEFGRHRGLGIIEGEVIRLEGHVEESHRKKVPHVGWNSIHAPAASPDSKYATAPEPWAESPLEGLADGTFMYFVHSYYPKPAASTVVLSLTKYGNTCFCSSLRSGNVFAFQFHPERSGPDGLRIYRNLAAATAARRE